MSGATVPVPVGVLEQLRDWSALAASQLRSGHANSIVFAEGGLTEWGNVLNEALSIAEGLDGPDVNALLVSELTPALAASEIARHDVEALLIDIVGTVGEYLNQCFVGDGPGTKAAMAALREAVRPLAKTVGDRDFVLAELCEAMRRQDLTVTLEIYSGPRSDNVVETIADYHVPRIPVKGDEIMLDDRRLLSVTWARLVGRAAVVRAKHWGHQPKPEEKF